MDRATSNTVVITQNALSTTAEKIADFNSTRRAITIKNLDGAIFVYIGSSNAVTSANGMELKNGESIEISSTAELWAIAASGTPSIAIMDETWTGK